MKFAAAINSILDAVGQTPVIPLRRLSPAGGALIYGKYEACNPTHSIKDRIARAMIEQAEGSGALRSGMRVIAATSGNTGVALALVCAVKRYPLTLYMPENASLEKRKMFEGFGAQLELTPRAEGVGGAARRAKLYVERHGDSHLVDQFTNPANPEAHRHTTAPEVIADFLQGVDAFVVGVGTGGSLTGIGEELQDRFIRCKMIAVEPINSAVLSGGKPGDHKIQQLGLGFIPAVLNRNLIDRIIKVRDQDAYEMTKQLARAEGMLLGLSSGANVWASIQVAKELGGGKRVLTMLADAGQRYFSLEKFFESEVVA